MKQQYTPSEEYLTGSLDITCTDESDVVQVEIQKRAGNRSVIYVHVNGNTVFRLCGVSNENLLVHLPKEPCIGCQLTLDFHSGRLWTDDEAKLWEEKTGTREATTKTLCDTIRGLMG